MYGVTPAGRMSLFTERITNFAVARQIMVDWESHAMLVVHVTLGYLTVCHVRQRAAPCNQRYVVLADLELTKLRSAMMRVKVALMGCTRRSWVRQLRVLVSAVQPASLGGGRPRTVVIPVCKERPVPQWGSHLHLPTSVHLVSSASTQRQSASRPVQTVSVGKPRVPFVRSVRPVVVLIVTLASMGLMAIAYCVNLASGAKSTLPLHA
jgi:hypothetical protein